MIRRPLCALLLVASAPLAACGDGSAGNAAGGTEGDPAGTGAASGGTVPLPADGALCAPCATADDCAEGAICLLNQQTGEKFCGSPCGEGCPSGYACQSIEVEGATTDQCVPRAETCQPAQPVGSDPADGTAGPDGQTGAAGSGICECAVAKRVFALYNEDRAAHGVGPVKWDEGTARLTAEAARWMAFEAGYQHSEDNVKGHCTQTTGNSSRGTFCYVVEERITRFRARNCSSSQCTVEEVAEGLYDSLTQYPSRYDADYTYYSVGVVFAEDTFWLTEWMNPAPSLPGGGSCFRCNCPGGGAEAAQVPLTYDPADTAAFCPHWANPIWDAVPDFPECTTPRFEDTVGLEPCGEEYPALN